MSATPWWRAPSSVRPLAGDGDHDDRAGLAAGLERVPASVEPAGAAVGLGSSGVERLPVASAFERGAQARAGAGGAQAASTRSRRACRGRLPPALVIAPWRRRCPLELSLGVRPRNGPSDSGRNLPQSPGRSSTVSASAVSVETPRRQTRRPTTSVNGASPASSAIARSKTSLGFLRRAPSFRSIELPWGRAALAREAPPA